MRPTCSILLLLPLLAGCGGGGRGTSSGGGTAPPPASTCPLPTPLAAPRFSTDIYPALTGGSCGGVSATSCHGGSSLPSGHINYFAVGSRSVTDVYNDLVNVVPASAPSGYLRIAPRDPAHSWLLVKITSDNPGGGYGTRMPQVGANVCQATVDNITTWINAGAPF